MKPERSPRWAKWRFMPEVEMWEAISLSLGIEPTQVRYEKQAWMGADTPFDEGDEFADRLEVLRANRSNRDYFPTPGALDISRWYKSSVHLSEFARFALLVGWSIPEELSRMVAAAATPTVSTDSDTCAFAEAVMNGGTVEWELWALRKKISPPDAAKLIFCIDPIRWPGREYAQGTIDDELSYKISMRAALLADHCEEWSLNSLVSFLGESDAPAGMQEAVRDRASEANQESSPGKPLSRHRWQEQEILRVINTLGHDPTMLPAPSRGKPGVKAEVRANLAGAEWQGTVFDKAWDRLRATGEIANAPLAP